LFSCGFGEGAHRAGGVKKGRAITAINERSWKLHSMFVLYNFDMSGEFSLTDIINILHQQLPLLEKRFAVEKLEVFGSYVRDEQRSDSDLDILASFKVVPSLLTFIALENYLSDLLGVKVDLVMKESLKPNIGQHILREAVPV
jgi:predicted nucleotidyltransferase